MPVSNYTKNLHSINALLHNRFGGKLWQGSHQPNGKCCVLELESQLRGIDWTDSPDAVRCIDLRSLNDISVDEETRAEWMSKVLAAWRGSLDWAPKDLQMAVEKLVIALVNEVISELPGPSKEIRKPCREAKTIPQAAAAAADAADARAARTAAAYAAAAYAARAARAAAAYAAADAAAAAAAAADARAARAARKKVFIIACKLWIAAGKSVQK